jgi:hypothetical protein
MIASMALHLRYRAMVTLSVVILLVLTACSGSSGDAPSSGAMRNIGSDPSSSSTSTEEEAKEPVEPTTPAQTSTEPLADEDSYTADELLTRAAESVHSIRSGHLNFVYEVASASSQTETTYDVWFNDRATYAVLNESGSITEVLQTTSEVCTRTKEGRWVGVDRSTVDKVTEIDPREVLAEVLKLDLAPGELHRLPDVITKDGQKAYVIEARVKSGSLDGEAAIVEPFELGTLDLTLQWSTAYPLSLRMDGKSREPHGSVVNEDVFLTVEHINVSPDFPEGLPVSCTALTS